MFSAAMAEQKVLGVTATPIRLKKTEGFADKFTHMALAAPEVELMKMNRLCPKVRYFGFSSAGSIDTGGVHTRAGDFASDELEVASDRPELLNHCVEQWKRLCAGRSTLAFCVSINHARHLAEGFNAMGVPAAMVCSETPVEERQQIYKRFEARELLVLTSRDVISIGADFPFVSAICSCRATKSLAVHLQQLGRGFRAHPGKEDLIVLCQAGNVLRDGLGPAEAERPWLLAPGVEPEGAGGAGFPMKQCVECGHLMPAQVHICPECGAPQPLREKSIRTDALVELKFDKAERRRDQQLHRWAAKAHANGYLQGWVLRQWEKKFPDQGLPQAAAWRGAIYGPDPMAENALAFSNRWGQICRKKGRPWSVALTALTREFDPQFLEDVGVDQLRQAWAHGTNGLEPPKADLTEALAHLDAALAAIKPLTTSR
jgi:hypothetical protein